MAEDKTHFGYETISTSQKTERVSEVFHSVAKEYDLMNDLMSFGLHRWWKQFAISRAQIRPQDRVLDLAGGTGDLTIGITKRLNEKGQVVLADINAAMLAKSRERLLNQGILKPVSWLQTNAEALPFPDHSFDKIIMAFGLRNVTYKERALQEMARLLKPGGRCVILEFSKVTHKPLSRLYDLYSFSILPKLGKWIVNDTDSYQYLAESIRMHPDQETLKAMMLAAGFARCEYQNVQGGIVAVHVGFSSQ